MFLVHGRVVKCLPISVFIIIVVKQNITDKNHLNVESYRLQQEACQTSSHVARSSVYVFLTSGVVIPNTSLFSH